MALTENIMMGLGRNSILESFSAIDMEQELANVEPLEEGTDPLEYMLQVAYECDLTVKHMDLSLVCEEYQYLRENGTEMIYEEGKIKGIVDKFKGFLDKLWSSIQKFFKTVIGKLSDRFKDDQAFMKKFEKYNTSDTVTITGPNIEMNEDVRTLNSLISAVEGCIEDAGKVAGKVTSDLRSKANSDNFDYDEALRSYCNDIFGEGVIPTNLKQVIKAHKVASASNRAISGKEAFKALQDNDKGELQKIYTKSKKFIDDAKKEAVKMEKELQKQDKDTAKVVHASVKILTKIGSWVSQLNKLGVYCVNKKRSLARAVILKLAKKSKKSDSSNTK